MLTITEVVSKTGVSKPVLTRACAAGDLKSVKTLTRTNTPKYLVRWRDVESWLDNRPIRTRRQAWREDELAAVCEMYATCTVAQLSEYVGRAPHTINNMVAKLRRSGELVNDRSVRPALLNPLLIPGTAILLARTCRVCGKFKDATSFGRASRTSGKRNAGQYASICAGCNGRRFRSHGKRIAAWIKAKQELTGQDATQRGQPYTSCDLEILTDTTKSHTVAALELGRTYAGVATKRRAIQVELRIKTIPLGWKLSIPKEIEQIQNHFRFIGKPVPEELWEW